MNLERFSVAKLSGERASVNDAARHPDRATTGEAITLGNALLTG